MNQMKNEEEIARCKNNIMYFIEKYVRMKTGDGNVPLHLTESQKISLRNPQTYITKFNHEKRKRRIN